MLFFNFFSWHSYSIFLGLTFIISLLIYLYRSRKNKQKKATTYNKSTKRKEGKSYLNLKEHEKKAVFTVKSRVKNNQLIVLGRKSQYIDWEADSLTRICHRRNLINQLTPVVFKGERYYQVLPKATLGLCGRICSVWEAGGRQRKLALFYLLAQDILQNISPLRVRQVLVLPGISSQSKQTIHFLFQKELSLEKKLNESQILQNQISIWLTENKLARKKFRKFKKAIPNKLLTTLFWKSTPLLKKELFSQYNNAIELEWNKWIKNLALKYGRIPRLIQSGLEKDMKELSLSLLEEKIRESSNWKLFYGLAELRRKKVPKFNPEKQEINFAIKKAPIGIALHWLELLSGLNKNYFIESFWQERVSIRIFSSAKFYYARALFSRKVLKSWELIQELSIIYPDNIALRNEIGIYANEFGKTELAEAIFTDLKERYPDHPVIIHNEATFFEKKARQEIAQRWKEAERIKPS